MQQKLTLLVLAGMVCISVLGTAYAMHPCQVDPVTGIELYDCDHDGVNDIPSPLAQYSSYLMPVLVGLGVGGVAVYAVMRKKSRK